MIILMMLAKTLAVAAAAHPSTWQEWCNRTGGPNNDGNNLVPPSEAGKTASVLKMPKAGGEQFVMSLVHWNCKASHKASISWSETCPPNGPRFVMLREPTAHVFSLYNHCQRGQGMQLHHYMPTTLRAWAWAWARGNDSPLTRSGKGTGRFWGDRACAYNPRDFQTTRLLRATSATRVGRRSRCAEAALVDGGALGVARAALRNATFVGVTHFMDASVCVAHFALHAALPRAGQCDDLCRDNAPKLAALSHGVDHEKLDEETLDRATLDAVWRLTRADQVLYADALARFVADARRVERAPGARLLCEALADPSWPGPAGLRSRGGPKTREALLGRSRRRGEH